MRNKTSMSDIIKCTFPGYVWLGTILFIGTSYFNLTVIDVLKEVRMELVILSIPFSYILGHIMSEVTCKLSKKLLGTNEALKDENAVSIMVKQKVKEKKLDLHLYEVLEYQLDDMLRLKGIPDTWSKYIDSANLTRQLYISGLFFAFSLLYNVMMTESPLVFGIMMAFFILFLFSARMRYKKLMRQYYREIQLNYLLACDLEIL